MGDTMKKIIFVLCLIVIGIFYFCNCYAEEGFQVLAPARAVKLSYQVIGENKVLVSALDAEDNPVEGLKAEDFVVQRGQKKARILSAESLETRKDVGLNVVLVVDNSFSMKERQAVQPLLSALEEFLRIVRPIDDIQVVVFDDAHTMKVNQRNLHVKTFRSNDVSRLRDFFRESFDRGLTNQTFLYEGMAAGLDLIQKTPEKGNKFLVVFSDGEDLNSILDRKAVEAAAKGIVNLAAYSIDYMPVPAPDPFLKSFAEAHGGKIWKATSATELLPIFQSFSTTLFHRYVVTYRFLNPPQGTLSLEPAELNFDMFTMTDGSPVLNHVFFEAGKSEIPGKYVLLKDRAQTQTFDEKTLKSAPERYYNLLNIVGKRLTQNPMARVRIVGCNSDTGVEKNNHDLSSRRAETVRAYLYNVWGVDPLRMKVETRNLPAQATAMDVLGGRAENQRVEIIYDLLTMQADAANVFITETTGIDEIKIRPQIVAEYGIADWELTLLGDNEPIKTTKGAGGLKPLYAFPLDELGRAKLAAIGNLELRIRVTDIYGDIYETTAGPCPVRVSREKVIHELVPPPSGSLNMEPDKITIEEVTTVDSSPLLNYVYFETGEGVIPGRYILFTDTAGTGAFKESELKGTMDKYHHILNIIGKRMTGHPEARIKIVGCNAHYGVERGKLNLSRQRAGTVQSYLKDIWGIDPTRMDIEARSLPAMASTNRVNEGRAENQRAEIYSDSPAIADTIKSTYLEAMSDAKEIRLLPQIQAGYGVAHWDIEIMGDDAVIRSADGKGEPAPAYAFDLKDLDLRKIGAYKNLSVRMEVIDEKGQSYKAVSEPSSVTFIKREEQVAQKTGHKVLEKYALVLFDFDRADIKEQNKAVLDQIIERIKQLPAARVKIVGHTDIIGKEDYNMRLSERRARAVYDQILARGITAGERITHEGIGPRDPLYDNSRPEGRALNRTVTIYLEYEEKE
ncbi:MAG: VWA domain-containing protein [Deltaproteobacteria bacterium]|nr:MAG: VWA domain-containing protein [Deltaproteobacteria bacterium]